MKPEELLHAMDGVSEQNVADANRRTNSLWKWILATACLAVVLGAVTLLRPQAPVVPPLEQVAAGEEGGPKKFLNYDGCQYTYLENGASYAISEEQLGKPLGTLEHQIVIGQEAHLKENLAATFGVGGTLYPISTYDPAYRLAVELEGSYYLCERSGHLDGTAMDAADFFEAAHFAGQVKEVSVQDHFEQETLQTIKGKKAEKLLELLAQSQPAELTDDDYQAIGEAQSSGKSFVLSLQLPDGTGTKTYVIPSLGIFMLGNDRYTLPEAFQTEFGSFFANLTK